jgi:hypothetical protein
VVSDELVKSPPNSPRLVGRVHLVSKDRLPASDLTGLPFERWEGNVSRKFITYAMQIPIAGTSARLLLPKTDELGVVDHQGSQLIAVDIKAVQTNNLEPYELHTGDNMQQFNFHMLAVEK